MLFSCLPLFLDSWITVCAVEVYLPPNVSQFWKYDLASACGLSFYPFKEQQVIVLVSEFSEVWLEIIPKM
jgi:hypothetical protein